MADMYSSIGAHLARFQAAAAAKGAIFFLMTLSARDQVSSESLINSSHSAKAWRHLHKV